MNDENMTLRPGEKIHVIFRRSFESDMRRHFIGQVVSSSESVARVQGFAFVFDPASNQFVRRPEGRTRLVALVDGGVIINILPEKAKIDKAGYVLGKDRRLLVTDGETFYLDINEFGLNR